MSRRNDSIPSTKIIESYPTYEGKGFGLNRNSINVSQDEFNLRQITFIHQKRGLRDMSQKSSLESTAGGRAMYAILSLAIGVGVFCYFTIC